MTSRSATFRKMAVVLALLAGGCYENGPENNSLNYTPPSPPAISTNPSERPKYLEGCGPDGYCELELADSDEANSICDGTNPKLYWKQGRRDYLFACECNCSSHDNMGWLIFGPSKRVQGVTLGKPAVAKDILEAKSISDIMTSHPFCEQANRDTITEANFVSLIKYPTGNEDNPYCFSVRTLSVINDSLLIEEGGRVIPSSDEEVFLITPAPVAERVRNVIRSAGFD